ncbi:MAG: toll/interleukin-1 receptor domain-containing protein [Proteobacteria bacterium]|nr:toll/interleukin-1 receptor domain-containing protein [Pseudomonadota bacterium]
MGRLFISHSCKDRLLKEEADTLTPAQRERLDMAQRVRDAAVAALEADDHFILLDQHELETGDFWRNQLLAWLGLCDGAAIFLTPDSAESDWVRYEAAILSWRLWANEALRVVPVLLGIDEADLDRLGFGPHGMKDIQALRASPAEVAAFSAGNKDVIEAFVARLALRFKALRSPANPGDEPLQRWVSNVETQLEPVRDKILQQAWDLLAIPPREWGDSRARLTVFAHYLLEAPIPRMQAALAKLKEGYVDARIWAGLVRLVAPAWVEPGAACALARPAIDPALAPAFQLRTRFERALKDYIHRALFPINPDRLVAYGLATEGQPSSGLPPFGEQENELAEQLQRDLATRTGLYDYWFSDDVDATRQELNAALALEPFFVGMNASVFASPELVAELRRRFHAARFVFCLSPPLPAGAAPPADVETIPPPDGQAYRLVGQMRGTLLPHTSGT